MDLISYSQCTIRFEPNNNQAGGRTYSNRSLIELRHDEHNRYFLRAVDVEKNREEIFNIQIKKPDAYKFGSSADQEDAVRSKNGIYLFKLKKESRDQFYQELRKIFEMLALNNTDSTQSSERLIPSYLTHNERSPYENSIRGRSRLTSFRNNKGILVDIHQLNEYIEQGDIDEAANRFKQLASQGAQFQITSSEKLSNEKMFPIRVRIDDGSSRSDEREEQLVLNVYKSTTIRDIQIAFEHTHRFPSSTQYFFINGNLADQNASMNDLNIHSDSSFLLCLIQQ